MCGRLTFFSSGDDIARAFSLAAPPTIGAARYNLAPTQPVGVIRLDARKQRKFGYVQWGLVPSWANDSKMSGRLINARAETLRSKPSFRRAYQRRRCLVVASGFYEWKREGKHKQPFFIHRADHQPLAFAGLWERWTKGDRPLDTCTLITTRPNPLIAHLHHRMPVILEPESFDVWLDRDIANPALLEPLLVPCNDDILSLYPVDPRVGSVKNDDPELIQPLAQNTSAA